MSKNYDQLSQITEKITGTAIEVHRALGPGLLKSAHDSCGAYKIDVQGLKVSSQVPLPVAYKNVKLESRYRLDLLIKDLVNAKHKSVSAITNIHTAQILSFLNISRLQVRLLINFKVRLLKIVIVRSVNNLKEFPRTQHSSRFCTKEQII